MQYTFVMFLESMDLGQGISVQYGSIAIALDYADPDHIRIGIPNIHQTDPAYWEFVIPKRTVYLFTMQEDSRASVRPWARSLNTLAETWDHVFTPEA